MTTAPAQPVIPKAAMDAGAVGFTPGVYPMMPEHDAFDAGEPAKLGRKGIVGTALHLWFFEGRDKFCATYEVLDQQYNLATKEGKAAKLAVEKTGKTAMNPAEHELVKAMLLALSKDETAKAVHDAPGERELSIFAAISGDGSKSSMLRPHTTLCKGRIDLAAKCLWDLKSTHCRDKQEFKNSVLNFGYYSQAAMYRELYAATHDGIYKPFRWLCVSNEPPHNVWWDECTGESLAYGLRWVDSMLTMYERYSDADKRAD
jgi:hypothetical protein